jgi:integrase/recombinase XerC
LKKLIDKKRVEFLESLDESLGYSDLTIKSYDESIKQALKYIEIIKEDNHILFNLMPYRIEISSLNAKTISKKLSAIRSFVEYLNSNNISVILKADDSIKVAKTLPKPISHTHILEAISQAQDNEKLVVIMLYTLGLRVSELASLKIENISKEWIRVIGKGNKQRDIPLISTTREYLDEYLRTKPINKFLLKKKAKD